MKELCGQLSSLLTMVVNTNPLLTPSINLSINPFSCTWKHEESLQHSLLILSCSKPSLLAATFLLIVRPASSPFILSFSSQQSISYEPYFPSFGVLGVEPIVPPILGKHSASLELSRSCNKPFRSLLCSKAPTSISSHLSVKQQKISQYKALHDLTPITLLTCPLLLRSAMVPLFSSLLRTTQAQEHFLTTVPCAWNANPPLPFHFQLLHCL